jgi:hypothetical protein
MQNKLLRQVAIMLFIVCLALPLFPQQSKKITWGIYGGWSWGTGYTFRWHSRPWSDRHVLQFHLGGYAQLNLSQRIGLQLDMNYQNLIDEWTFHHPSFPYNSGEDSYGFSSLSLKGIYSLPNWGLFQLYMAAGGGISWGEWYSYSGVYFHLIGNPGVKIFLLKSNPNVALNLGCSFVYIYDPDEWHSADDFYIRLNFGIEF